VEGGEGITNEFEILENNSPDVLSDATGGLSYIDS
jgi:hypothetical protein